MGANNSEKGGQWELTAAKKGGQSVGTYPYYRYAEVPPTLLGISISVSLFKQF